MSLPLVAAQPGIWLADQLLLSDNAYIVSHYLELKGDLDIQAFCSAILQGMAETDTLQMSFEDVDGEVVQQFNSSELPVPEILDLRKVADSKNSAREIMSRDMASNVRLNSGNCLVRHILMQVGDREWYWYQRYHHIQVDAYSFTALTRRMVDLYTAGKRGTAPVTSAFKPLQGAIEEYEKYHASMRYLKDAAYWKQVCSELPEPTSLKPLNNAQPSKSIIRSEITFEVDGELALALVVAWLLRLSNAKSMGVGFIFMRRLGSAALHTAGAFINVLPMKVEIDQSTTLSELAASVEKSIRTMRKHQKMDSESISRDVLYGPVINYKAFDYHLDFESVEPITHHLASGPIRDIEMVLFVDSGTVKVEYLANADRYDKHTLDRNLARLPLLYDQFSRDPRLPCAKANLLFPDEYPKIIPRVIEDATLVSLLDEQARKTPDRRALQDEQEELTYREMHERALKVAHELKNLGAGPGDIIAVSLPRSVALAVTLQAVLLTGAAYVPLDPGYPSERVEFMIEDAQPKIIIDGDGTKLNPKGGGLCLPRESHVAYIIYTSGSTGKPKGVMVGHKAITNRLMWMQDQYTLTSDDAVLQKTPSSFDVSVWEFFWPLIVGARLVMAPPEAHKDPERLRAIIDQFKITTVHFVPSMLYAFLSHAHGISLRRAFCSGEALSTKLARSWEKLTGVPLHNLYGPTEAAIDVTYHKAFGPELSAEHGTNVPIGYPVWNTAMHVLDSEMRHLPVGAAGDLYISGMQLAEGYLNRPELTEQRFFKLGDGPRVYKTGDVAQLLPSGALEFLGRSDDQIKLRGQRIELGEIEAVLSSLPGVKQAVCFPQSLVEGDEDSRQLIGYVVGDIDVDFCSSRLADQLPAYMVPRLMVLAEMPISVTGKVDRKALPKPSTVVADSRELKGLEVPVAEAFKELLGVSATADDDFFSLGGHSLLAVRLAALLRSRLGLPVTIGQIMQTPKVSSLAAQLASEDQEAWRTAGFEVVLKMQSGTDKQPRTVHCIHPASGFAWQFSVLRRYLDPRWSLVGIQSTKSGPLAKAQSLTDVTEAHFQTITQQSEGPYYLLGYSLGGTLAHALAARLEAAGKEVAFLGLLDTWPPETQNWDGKKVDQAVVDEMRREREQFTAQQGNGSADLFDVIEDNYESAVRLLATARSAEFKGTTTLFVAERTFPQGTDLEQVWRKFTNVLHTIPIDSSHIDIISPTSFETLGPRINELLHQI